MGDAMRSKLMIVYGIGWLLMAGIIILQEIEYNSLHDKYRASLAGERDALNMRVECLQKSLDVTDKCIYLDRLRMIQIESLESSCI